MAKPLPLTEVTRRLKPLGFGLVKGPSGLLVYTRNLAPFFPYATTRKIAYHVPAVYDELGALPIAVIEDILLHLFLNSDEEQEFWRNEVVH